MLTQHFPHPHRPGHVATIQYGSCGEPNQIHITRDTTTDIIETCYDVETECIWSGKQLYIFTHLQNDIKSVPGVNLHDVTPYLCDGYAGLMCVSPSHATGTLVAVYRNDIAIFRGNSWGRLTKIPFGHWRFIAVIAYGVILVTGRVAWNAEIGQYDEYEPLSDSDDRALIYDNAVGEWYTTNDPIDLSQYQIWTNVDGRLCQASFEVNNAVSNTSHDNR